MEEVKVKYLNNSNALGFIEYKNDKVLICFSSPEGETTELELEYTDTGYILKEAS